MFNRLTAASVVSVGACVEFIGQEQHRAVVMSLC